MEVGVPVMACGVLTALDGDTFALERYAEEAAGVKGRGCEDSGPVICFNGGLPLAVTVDFVFRSLVPVVVGVLVEGNERPASSEPTHICGVPLALQLPHGRPLSHTLPSFYTFTSKPHREWYS